MPTAKQRCIFSKQGSSSSKRIRRGVWGRTWWISLWRIDALMWSRGREFQPVAKPSMSFPIYLAFSTTYSSLFRCPRAQSIRSTHHCSVPHLPYVYLHYYRNHKYILSIITIKPQRSIQSRTSTSTSNHQPTTICATLPHTSTEWPPTHPSSPFTLHAYILDYFLPLALVPPSPLSSPKNHKEKRNRFSFKPPKQS